MRRARLTGSLFPALAVSALLWSCLPAAAGQQAVTVRSLHVDNAQVQSVDGVRLTAPGQATAETRVLRENDSLAPGTVIEVPDRTMVRLVTSNGTEITLLAKSRTKLNTISAKGESITQIIGEAWFKVTRALDFFEVAHDRFLAAVKGTEFKVTADDREIQFGWVEGLIKVSRDVRIRIAGAAQEDYLDPLVVAPDEADDLQNRGRHDVERCRHRDRQHVIIEQLLPKLVLLHVKEVDIVEGETAFREIAPEVRGDRPDEVGVVERTVVFLLLEMEVVENVHRPVGLILVLDKGEI
jgi:hypothetical protein